MTDTFTDTATLDQPAPVREWVRTRAGDSWHVVRTPTRVPGRYLTLCGRIGLDPTHPSFPSEERTCESCLRLMAKS